MKTKPIEERFWPKVQRTHACWLWTGSTDGRGYGQLSSMHAKSPVKAHRVSWELANGPIPDGLSVLHACDTPGCVRPDHLFVGTQRDNMRDAAEKGRTSPIPVRKGVAHHNAKLNQRKVRRIRAMYRAGETQTAIAEAMNVTQTCVSLVLSGKTWSHVI